jgi:hypothetical protein
MSSLRRPLVQLGASFVLWLAMSAAFWSFVAYEVNARVSRGVRVEDVDDALVTPALDFSLGLLLVLLAANVVVALGRWLWSAALRRAARRQLLSLAATFAAGLVAGRAAGAQGALDAPLAPPPAAARCLTLEYHPRDSLALFPRTLVLIARANLEGGYEARWYDGDQRSRLVARGDWRLTSDVASLIAAARQMDGRAPGDTASTRSIPAGPVAGVTVAFPAGTEPLRRRGPPSGWALALLVDATSVDGIAMAGLAVGDGVSRRALDVRGTVRACEVAAGS